MATITATQQRKTALQRANQIRLRRAALKHAIRAGERRISDILDDYAVQTATLYELLRAPYRMGPAKSRALLRMIGASPTLRVTDLTDRQRTLLLDILEAGGL